MRTVQNPPATNEKDRRGACPFLVRESNFQFVIGSGVSTGRFTSVT
jgi:hypothetical protein